MIPLAAPAGWDSSACWCAPGIGCAGVGLSAGVELSAGGWVAAGFSGKYRRERLEKPQSLLLLIPK